MCITLKGHHPVDVGVGITTVCTKKIKIKAFKVVTTI
jgi:hypothetical protein